jgi:hypothetical protein
MSVGTISFWQQNQKYWSKVHERSQSQAATNTLITAVGQLMVNKAKGLASIANQQALTRTNNALTSALKSAIATTTGSSTSTASSTPATPPTPVAATGTGTVPLAANTSLMTLGIPPSGTITVSDGTNTTKYTSTGTDTVADLLNAINASGPKNAQAAAWLDRSGHLVIAAQNNTDTIMVGGNFASDIGFGSGNNTFSPTTSSAGASTASTSSTTTTSSASSASTTPKSSSPVLFNSAHALQTSSATASLLASGLSSGSVINLLL